MVSEKRAALSVALRSTGRPTAKSPTPAASKLIDLDAGFFHLGLTIPLNSIKIDLNDNYCLKLG